LSWKFSIEFEEDTFFYLVTIPPVRNRPIDLYLHTIDMCIDMCNYIPAKKEKHNQ